MTNEEFIAFVKKNPISVGCGLLALALGAGVYLRQQEIPEAEEILAQKTAMAEKYALNIKYSAQLKEQLEAVTTAVQEIDTRLIRASQLGTNTQFFYKLQSDTGVRLLDFRQATGNAPAAAKTKPAYTPVSFNVSVQGTLPQLLNFLRQLESGTHYSRVLTASCTGNPVTRTQPLTLSLNLELLGVP